MTETSTDEGDVGGGPEAGGGPGEPGARPAPFEGAAEGEGETVSRVQAFLHEFGVPGVIVMLTLSALTYVGFVVAIYMGFEVEGAGQSAGVLAAAAAGWALTKPIRIPVAIALTPVVVAVLRKLRKRGPEAPPAA